MERVVLELERRVLEEKQVGNQIGRHKRKAGKDQTGIGLGNETDSLGWPSADALETSCDECVGGEGGAHVRLTLACSWPHLFDVPFLARLGGISKPVDGGLDARCPTAVQRPQVMLLDAQLHVCMGSVSSGDGSSNAAAW